MTDRYIKVKPTKIKCIDSDHTNDLLKEGELYTMYGVTSEGFLLLKEVGDEMDGWMPSRFASAEEGK